MTMSIQVDVSGNGSIDVGGSERARMPAGGGFRYPGAVVQVQVVENGGSIGLAAAIPLDSSVPQISEGSLVCTLNFTPRFADSTLIVEASATLGEVTNTSDGIVAAVFQDGAVNAIAAGYCIGYATALNQGEARVHKVVTPGSAAAIAFTLRAGVSSGAARLNGVGTGDILSGRTAAYLKVTEIAT